MNTILHRLASGYRSGVAAERCCGVAVVSALLALGLTSPVEAVTYYATYELDGGTATQSNQTYSASATDTSGVWASNSGVLTLDNCAVTTTGDSSDVNASSQYGLNAGVLATAAARISLSGLSLIHI